MLSSGQKGLAAWLTELHLFRLRSAGAAHVSNSFMPLAVVAAGRLINRG